MTTPVATRSDEAYGTEAGEPAVPPGSGVWASTFRPTR